MTRKTIKQLQGESDYWRIKFINEQQRAEAAEAKLEKQKPMAYRWESPVNGKICYDGIKPLGVISQPLYFRPAPAVSLAELVPPKASMADYYENVENPNLVEPDEAGITMWDACRSAILRRIEEAG